VIVQCAEHRRNTHVAQIDYCQIVSTVSAKKASDISGIRKSHFKMNREFKVIQGHPYQYQQKSRTDCCRNVQQYRTLFPKQYSVGKTANSSISTTPLRFDDSYLRNAFEHIDRSNLYCQKLESLIYISAAKSVGLHLFLHAIILESQTCGVKKC